MAGNRENQQTQTDEISRRTTVAGLAGVVTAGGILSTLSGTASAHFPTDLDVAVDPLGEGPLPHPDRGVVRVAISNIDDVDVTADPTRYRFGAPAVVADGGGAESVRACRVRDVNGDGTDDLSLWFRLADAGFTAASTTAELRWNRDETNEHGLSGTAPISFHQPPDEVVEDDSC